LTRKFKKSYKKVSMQNNNENDFVGVNGEIGDNQLTRIGGADRWRAGFACGNRDASDSRWSLGPPQGRETRGQAPLGKEKHPVGEACFWLGAILHPTSIDSAH
jgi:hypothetical protein